MGSQSANLDPSGTRRREGKSGRETGGMSLEAWSTIAAFGTFVVIGATAILALVQLRHLRASNQIAGILKFADAAQSASLLEARRFVREEIAQRLHDPDFRRALGSVPVGTAAQPLLFLGNFYEQLGLFVKRGLIDEYLACDLWSAQALGDWMQMEAAIAIMRRTQGNSVLENFEYFADVSEQWIKRHPAGSFPKNRARRVVRDVWLDRDQGSLSARQ